jgi:CheY-like chemotaxis protein
MTQASQRPDTILVVDGDIITRSVISDYLRHCGYRVIEANDATEAQQALAHERFEIDVLLCDVELPGGINGFHLATWARENWPGVKVVLSAAANRTGQTAGDLCEEGPHLAKPYDPAIILDHIRRLKGGRSV